MRGKKAIFITGKKGPAILPDDYVLTTARNTEEINSLRTIWQQFQSRPNSDIDHYLHVCAEDKSVIRPHVVLLEHCRKPVAIAVGRIENYRLLFKFGYKSVFSLRTKALGIVYDGFLGDFSLDHGKIILDSFLKTVSIEKLDLIRFSYLRIGSPIYELATTVPGIFRRDHLGTQTLHWRMIVPENIEGFFRSRPKKHRSRIRGLRKVLEGDFPGQVQFKIFTDSSNLVELIADVESVARKTYQKGLGIAFVNSPEMRQRLRAFAERKQLRAYLLYIKDEPYAFWLGRSYVGTFYATHTGYDPAYKSYELGTILFIHMLQDLAEATNIKYIDFGFGDAPYKARFANECWKEETVYIFARSLSGFRLNIIRTILGICSACTIGLFHSLGIENRIKRLIRNRLVKRLKQESGVEHRCSSKPKSPHI